MTTKKILYGIVMLSFSSALMLTSCKKKEEEKKEEPVKTETPDGQSGTDNREVQGENDQATNEINEVISKTKELGGRSSGGAGITGICGFDVDSVSFKQDTIVFKYNGVLCLNRIRTGNIRLSWVHGTKWTNAGATIKVEYLNYKVVRASDQRSWKLNGVQYLKNESGGTWLNLLIPGGSLVNSITGTNLVVTFEDNKTATYNINRKITYTYPGSVLTIKAEGIGTNNGVSSLENYGTARNGDQFTSQVSTPIVWNAACGGAVLQGVVNLKDITQNIELVFTYGVDASGNPQAATPTSCPFGWKLGWTANGTSSSKVFGYN